MHTSLDRARVSGRAILALGAAMWLTGQPRPVITGYTSGDPDFIVTASFMGIAGLLVIAVGGIARGLARRSRAAFLGGLLTGAAVVAPIAIAIDPTFPVLELSAILAGGGALVASFGLGGRARRALVVGGLAMVVGGYLAFQAAGINGLGQAYPLVGELLGLAFGGGYLVAALDDRAGTAERRPHATIDPVGATAGPTTGDLAVTSI